MRKERGIVLSQEEVAPGTRLLWLAAPLVARGAQPGQFAMLRCGQGFDPLLPRPMSFHRFRQGQGGRETAFLYKGAGRGADWLAQRRVGDEVELFGPLGRGFAPQAGAGNLLLLAGGLGIAPLVALAEEALARGPWGHSRRSSTAGGPRSVALLMGARTARELYPLELLPPELEVAIATDDGSAGHGGSIIDLAPEYLPWADQLFASGPRPMYASLAQLLRRLGRPGDLGTRKAVQVLLEERMACGTGICYGCAVETRRGTRLVCRDGPRFDLREVF